MQSVNDLIQEHRDLRERSQDQPWTLTVGEHRRLDVLERAFSSRGGGRRRYSRKPILGSGELAVGSARTEVDLVDISVGGARVECALPVGLGQRVRLRTWRLSTGTAVDFSAEVVWRADGELGLEFFGRPREARVDGLLEQARSLRACRIGW
ncbi:MAG: PilZ domain-containing protein [Deltaproteobacteria bacterium]|nr:PilZ domain-containing protein [Deltaproteobacteria bacterium]